MLSLGFEPGDRTMEGADGNSELGIDTLGLFIFSIHRYNFVTEKYFSIPVVEPDVSTKLFIWADMQCDQIKIAKCL